MDDMTTQTIIAYVIIFASCISGVCAAIGGEPGRNLPIVVMVLAAIGVVTGLWLFPG